MFWAWCWLPGWHRLLRAASERMLGRQDEFVLGRNEGVKPRKEVFQFPLICSFIDGSIRPSLTLGWHVPVRVTSVSRQPLSDGSVPAAIALVTSDVNDCEQKPHESNFVEHSLLSKHNGKPCKHQIEWPGASPHGMYKQVGEIELLKKKSHLNLISAEETPGCSVGRTNGGFLEQDKMCRTSRGKKRPRITGKGCPFRKCLQCGLKWLQSSLLLRHVA